MIPCGGFVGNLLMRGTGKSGDISAGTYTLATGMTLDEAVRVLTTPPKEVPTADVLIPPGYRLTQIADAVEEALGIPADEFLARAAKGTFERPAALPARAPLEGFLLPQTYRIPERDGADAVIQRLLDQFAEEAAKLPWENAERARRHALRDRRDRVDDREGSCGPTRPAADRRGHLQPAARGHDARHRRDAAVRRPDARRGTVDGRHRDRRAVQHADARGASADARSRARTSASLRAALEPADTPYLYYVLCDDDGGHRFAVTYDEHLANVDACLG